MTAFQIILLIAAGLMLLLTGYAMITRPSSRPLLAFWMLVWIAAIVAASVPDMTTKVAQALGIERGKDLLLYCAVMFMLIGFFMLYARLRAVRRELTLLVREIAIQRADESGAAN